MKSIFSFTPYPENLSDDELVKLFAEPPGYEEFIKPINQFLLGAKGSGKSTLLRAVSAPFVIQRGKLDDISFLGFYVSFSSIEGDLFKQNYNNIMSPEIFEHYLCLRTLVEIIKVLKNLEQLRDVGNVFVSEILQKYIPFSKNLELPKALKILQDQVRLLRDKLGQNPSLLKIDLSSILIPEMLKLSVTSLMSDFSEYLREYHHPVPCLLIDGSDYLCDAMRLSIQALARKELPFRIKIAGRYIYDDPNQTAKAKCEWRRDIDILCLDHDASTKAYKDLCLNTANNLQANQNSNLQCEDIFGMEQSNKEQELYSGLEVFIKLSSGNLKRFLDLCELAGNNKPDLIDLTNRPIVPFSNQHHAARDLARDLFLDDLPEDAGEYFKKLRSFIYWAIDMVRQLPKNEQTLCFILQGNVMELATTILYTGFKYRHLLCSNKDFCTLNLTPGFLPYKFSINSAFAPKFKILPISDIPQNLDAQQVHQFMEKPTIYDPEYNFPFGKKKPTSDVKEPHFPEMSSQILPVFISHPLSLQEPEETTKNKRITLIKRTIKNIMNDECSSLPEDKRIKESQSCIAAKDLPTESSPDFRVKVEQRINNASYTIHDITVPTNGVFFELGLAAAFRTPYFLFLHEDDLTGDEYKLPNKLSGLDKKKYSKSRDGAFNKWFKERFHNIASSSPNKISCRFHSFDDECSWADSINKTSRPILYLAISDVYQDIRNTISNIAHKEFNMIIQDDWHLMHSLDAHCSLCAPIQACSCAIGLCVLDDYLNAVVLGLLQGLKKNFILFSDRSDPQINTPAMSREKMFEYSPSTMKIDIENSVRDFLQRHKDNK